MYLVILQIVMLTLETFLCTLADVQLVIMGLEILVPLAQLAKLPHKVQHCFHNVLIVLLIITVLLVKIYNVLLVQHPLHGQP